MESTPAVFGSTVTRPAGVRKTFGFGRFARPPALLRRARQLLQFIPPESAPGRLAGERRLLAGVIDLRQLVGRVRGDLPGLHVLLDRLGELQQRQRPGDRGVADLEALGELPLGEAPGGQERPVGAGLLDRLQVLAQGVLDELVLQQVLGRGVLRRDDAGERRQPGQPGGAVAALADDDDVAIGRVVPADPDRLELAPLLERLGQAARAPRGRTPCAAGAGPGRSGRGGAGTPRPAASGRPSWRSRADRAGAAPAWFTVKSAPGFPAFRSFIEPATWARMSCLKLAIRRPSGRRRSRRGPARRAGPGTRRPAPPSPWPRRTSACTRRSACGRSRPPCNP